jgi:hypothetical protein
VYKVRVRAEYLENPAAIVADVEARHRAVSRTRDRLELPPVAAPTPPSNTFKIARWFDVKEHAAALGMILALACAVLVRAYDPRRDGATIGPITFGFAVAAAATTWFAAIVGIIVASYRSVGAL